MGIMETVLEIPAEHEANVFGQFDAFAKKIERSLHVNIGKFAGGITQIL